MRYYLFKCGEKEYKLRLTAQSIIDTEERLGRSILDVMLETNRGSLPKLEELIIILKGAMSKYDMKLSDMYELYDEYIESGGDLSELIAVVSEVMKVSGFFKETAKETE